MEVLLSEAEQVFIVHGICDNLRSDGRFVTVCPELFLFFGNCDYRSALVETAVVSNTNGSARVRLGSTDVLVGIKAEINTPLPTSPRCGKIQFFVDCSANATPEFEGRGGEEIARDVTSALTTAFNNNRALDLRSLLIAEFFYCWTLYVDVVILECGGSVYDTVGMAVKSALFNLRIPKVSVSYNEKKECELEVSDQPHDLWQLNISNVPLLVTVCKIGTSNVVDATVEEEACVRSHIVMGITESACITMIRQEGKGSLDPESTKEMVELGCSTSVILHSSLMKTLLDEATLCRTKMKGFL